MNYAEIKMNDIANGPGVRISLFVSGCRHRCPGCFNSEAWDFNFGKPFKETVAYKILDAASPEHISGLTLLGGEPFEPENRLPLTEFTAKFRERYPQKNVWCFTGFTYEELLRGDSSRSAEALLRNIDTLVDGRFVKELHSASLIFRGSSNQRIINVQRSLAEGHAILMDGVWERRMGNGNIYDA